MTNEKLNRISEDLSSLTILEVSELVTFLEGKWNVSAAAAVAVAGPAAASTAAEEKTEWKVTLKSLDDSKKLGAIKILREVNKELDLKGAKAIVDGLATAPVVIKEGASKEESEKLKKDFAELGGVVELS